MDHDDDILIGGWTVYDTDLAALDAIMAEWGSERSYQDRIANLNGSTGGAGFYEDPVWSPDGSKIVFRGEMDGTGDIWVMPSQGGDPVQITSGADNDWAPSWSPDGKYIAFWSDRSACSQESMLWGSTQIWFCHAIPTSFRADSSSVWP